jgi:hypothetical protein
VRSLARGPWLRVLAALAILGAGAAAVALATDSGVEREVRETFGLLEPGCAYNAVDSRGWSEGPSLPDEIDEPRAVTIGERIYLVGGIADLEVLDRRARLPGQDFMVEVESSPKLLVFDPRTGDYSELAPLPVPMNHAGVAVHDGTIYVVGGHGDMLNETPLGDAFRWSPGQRRWERLPPLPTPRGAAAVGVIGDELYVAGGVAETDVLDTVEVLDLETLEWRRGPDMLQPRHHTAFAAVDGRLYVAGGRDLRTDSLATVEALDPSEGRWRRVPPLPERAGGGAAVDYDGDLLVIGGGDDRRRTVTGAVQRFDPDSREWSQLPPMRTKRHGFGATVFGDRVYTFGGSPCALFAKSSVVEVFEPPEEGA